MPYKIEWNNTYALLSVSGNVTYEELREVGKDCYGDIRLDDIEYYIVDFREAELSQITTNQINMLAAVDSITVLYKPDFKMAFVIGNQQQRVLCESYIKSSKSFKSTWPFAIFNNFEDARNWGSL